MGIGIQTFNVTVASAGTRVRVKSTTTYAQAIIFESHDGNTGNVYIGNSSMTTASYVKRLTAGNSFSINALPQSRPGPDGGMLELSQFYVDSSTAAQVVCVSYILHVGTF